jgi:hypothetical protein
MIKSEKKNEKNSPKKKTGADKKCVIQSSTVLELKKLKIAFTLPCKYGPLPIKVDFSRFSSSNAITKLTKISIPGLNSRISSIGGTSNQPSSSL